MVMKKWIIPGALLLTAAMVFTGCEKLNKVNFEHKVDVYFDVNPVNPGNYTYAEVVVTNDIEAALNDYKGSLDKLQSLKIIGFQMTIEFPAGSTFDPYDQLDAYIEAGNLGKGLIATIDPVPDGGLTFISFYAEDLELVDYFKYETFTLWVEGSNSGQTTGVTSFKVTMKFALETQVI